MEKEDKINTNKKGINVLSLFDGMSCGQIVLNNLGIKINKYYASEIKNSAIKVTLDNYPKTIQLGDITKINAIDLPQIDLLIGGSPCQDFSSANKNKKGLEGEKSKLFFEYLRLLKETKPKYFLLENVKMSKVNQDIISNYLGVEPIFIDSHIVTGVYRKRLYWTNIKNIPKLEDKNILLKDVIDYGFVNREKGMCLLESLSRPLKTPTKITRRYLKYGFWQIIFKDEKTFIKLNKDYNLTLDGDVRYMTRNELERSQNVPLNYTKIVTRNEAAGLLGDGWTIKVVEHLLKNIQ